MFSKLLDLFFAKEEWCHCPCDQNNCAGKLYFCSKCDDAYCENCIDICCYFSKLDPICEWCSNK